MENLQTKKVPELRALCKKLGITGYSKLKKAELIVAIQDYKSKGSKKSKVTITSKKKQKKAPVKKKSTAQTARKSGGGRAPKKTRKTSKDLDFSTDTGSSSEEEEEMPKTLVLKKKVPAKNVSFNDDEKVEYEKLRVFDLVKICQDRGMPSVLKNCKKGTRKAELIKLLKQHDRQGKGKDKEIEEDDIEIEEREFECFDSKGNRTCDDDKICDTFGKKCIRKTKAGRPWGEKSYEHTYGSKYNYDEELGIIGTKEVINKARAKAKKGSSFKKKDIEVKPSAKKKPAPKAKAKKPSCDDPDIKDECSPDQYCDSHDYGSKCISKKNPKFRKGNVIGVVISGRTPIFGDKERILQLYDTFKSKTSPGSPPPRLIKYDGSEYNDGQTTQKKVSPKKVSPKKPPPKKVPPKKPLPKTPSPPAPVDDSDKEDEDFVPEEEEEDDSDEEDEDFAPEEEDDTEEMSEAEIAQLKEKLKDEPLEIRRGSKNKNEVPSKRSPKGKEKEKVEESEEEEVVEEEPKKKEPAKSKRGRRQKEIGEEDLKRKEEEKRPSSRVDASRDEIMAKFRKCLESYGK